MVVMMLVLVLVIVVMMVMVALAFRIIALVLIVVVMLRLQRFHGSPERVAALDRANEIGAGQMVPRRGDDRRLRVQFPHHGKDLV